MIKITFEVDKARNISRLGKLSKMKACTGFILTIPGYAVNAILEVPVYLRYCWMGVEFSAATDDQSHRRVEIKPSRHRRRCGAEIKPSLL